jgi:hypothetical protein
MVRVGGRCGWMADGWWRWIREVGRDCGRMEMDCGWLIIGRRQGCGLWWAVSIG